MEADRGVAVDSRPTRGTLAGCAAAPGAHARRPTDSSTSSRRFMRREPSDSGRPRHTASRGADPPDVGYTRTPGVAHAAGGPCMTQSAEVVIIGGGVTGASTAFHLAQRGVRDVVLVEKDLLASGPTGRSSACVRQHYSTPETCRMVLHALRFFERFAEHTGGRTASFTRVGYLLGVDERLRVPMEKSVALQQSVGIDTRLVTPAEMREIEPRVRVDDFVAGCYEPEAGYADPSQTTQGLAAAAREGGARILEGAEVTGIRVDGGRVRGVSTSR